METVKVISGDGDINYNCSPRVIQEREKSAEIKAETKSNHFFGYNKFEGKCVQEAGNVEIKAGVVTNVSGDSKFE